MHADGERFRLDASAFRRRAGFGRRAAIDLRADGERFGLDASAFYRRADFGQGDVSSAGFLPFPGEARQKMPLALDAVRPQAQAAALRRADTGQIEGVRLEIGMRAQKFPHGALVFQPVERARGIHQLSAGAHHVRRVVQNRRLPRGAARGRVRVPLGRGFRVAAEHALAGAGRVHQHAVEKRGQRARQRFRRSGGYKGVRDAQPLEVSEQDARAGKLDLVGKQEAPAVQPRRDLPAFAAGRGAQVEHALAGPRVERRHGRHRGCVLQIKRARGMGDSRARLRVRRQIAPQRLPRNPRRTVRQEGRGGLLRAVSLRIQAQRPPRRKRERAQEGGKFVLQNFAAFVQKRRRITFVDHFYLL